MRPHRRRRHRQLQLLRSFHHLSRWKLLNPKLRSVCQKRLHLGRSSMDSICNRDPVIIQPCHRLHWCVPTTTLKLWLPLSLKLYLVQHWKLFPVRLDHRLQRIVNKRKLLRPWLRLSVFSHRRLQSLLVNRLPNPPCLLLWKHQPTTAVSLTHMASCRLSKESKRKQRRTLTEVVTNLQRLLIPYRMLRLAPLELDYKKNCTHSRQIRCSLSDGH